MAARVSTIKLVLWAPSQELVDKSRLTHLTDLVSPATMQVMEDGNQILTFFLSGYLQNFAHSAKCKSPMKCWLLVLVQRVNTGFVLFGKSVFLLLWCWPHVTFWTYAASCLLKYSRRSFRYYFRLIWDSIIGLM